MGSKNACLEEDGARALDDSPPVWIPGQELDSRLLLGSASTVLIRHGDETYTLRETRAGKLILTK
ncbi:MAG: hemin uptake protein HemP [Pseudomonadota bacterium]